MQNEKSQIQNRAAALRSPRSRDCSCSRRPRRLRAQGARRRHQGQLGRPDAPYVLNPYQMVRNLRTSNETGNPDRVFDGDIDDFFEAGIGGRSPSTGRRLTRCRSRPALVVGGPLTS